MYDDGLSYVQTRVSLEKNKLTFDYEKKLDRSFFFFSYYLIFHEEFCFVTENPKMYQFKNNSLQNILKRIFRSLFFEDLTTENARVGLLDFQLLLNLQKCMGPKYLLISKRI